MLPALCSGQRFLKAEWICLLYTSIGYYREYYKDRGIFENRVYDGFEAVASKLKEDGKTLVVATSKPEPFARQIIEDVYKRQHGI